MIHEASSPETPFDPSKVTVKDLDILPHARTESLKNFVSRSPSSINNLTLFQLAYEVLDLSGSESESESSISSTPGSAVSLSRPPPSYLLIGVCEQDWCFGGGLRKHRRYGSHARRARH